MAKTHLVWGFPPPPKAQQRGRQRKEAAGVRSIPPALGARPAALQEGTR